MKGAIKLHEFQAKRKVEEEPWVRPQPCHVCGTMLKGAYGQSWIGENLVWSCSKKCEQAVQKLKEQYNVSLFGTQDKGAAPNGP